MPKIPDVVVLVPGIGGSVLAKDGRELWGTGSGAIARAVVSRGNSIRELQMAADADLNDLGDGVTASELVHDLHIVPGLWKIDGYTKVAKRLISELELTPGQNFFEFPYDWRRDNRGAARRLSKIAMDWLHAWRRQSNNPKARFIFVVHSMGGLVARYFLEVLDGWNETRALFSVGTPYFGSLNALGFLANGFSKSVGPISVDFSKVLASFTSVYQLLPTYPCINVGTDKLTLVADAKVPGVDAAKTKAAADFHAEILKAQSKNAKNETYCHTGYKVFPIVGREQPTFQSAQLSSGTITLLRHYKNKDDSGDGTVPVISAVPEELRNQGKEMFAAECHGSLQNFEAVLVQLVGGSEGQHIDFNEYRARIEPPVKLGLDIDDVYSANMKSEVSVRPTEGRPKLIGLVQDAKTGLTACRIDFRPSADGVQHGDFSLPEGTYRMSVSGSANISSVTDTFMVVGESIQPN